jgi:hypothetical protein
MASSIIEVVIYSAKPGVSKQEMLAAVEATNVVLRRFPGYIKRELAFDPRTEQWLDLVHWTSRKAALDAIDAFGLHPEVEALTAVIEPRHMTLQHFESAMTDAVAAAIG